MVQTVSYDKFIAPENRGKVLQAQKLIRKGQEGAAFDDPVMRRYIETLKKIEASREFGRKLQEDLSKPIQDNLSPQSSVQRYIQEEVLKKPAQTNEQQVLRTQNYLRDIGFKTKQTSKVLPTSEVSSPSTLPPVQGPERGVNPTRYEGERYDPRTNKYVVTSPTGEQGTSYARPPTVEEKIKLEKLNKVKTIGQATKYVEEKAGEYAEKGAKKLGVKGIKIPEQQLFFEIPTQQTAKEFSVTGKPLPEYNVLKAGGNTIFTPEQIGKGVKGTIKYGKYAIPYAGQAIFVGEATEEINKAGGPIKFAKERPVETALLLGGAAFFSTLKVAKGLRGTVKTIAGTEGENLIVREGRNLIGKKKTRILYTIENKPIIPEPIFTKAKVMTGDEGYFAVIGKETIREGEKKIVTKVGKKRFLQYDDADKLMYSGDPFSKLGKVERKQTIKELTKLGLQEKEVKNLLALRRQRRDVPFAVGQAKAIKGENGKELVLFTAEGRIGQSKEFQEGIKSFTKKKLNEVEYLSGVSRKVGRVDDLKAYEYLDVGQNIKRGKEGIYVKLATKDYKPVRIESGVEVLGKAKGKGEVVLGDIFPMKARTEGLSLDLSGVPLPTTELYKSASRGEKGIEYADIFSKAVGTTEKGGAEGIKFIETGGKKSSQEYFQKLYGEQINLFASRAAKKISKPTKSIKGPSMEITAKEVPEVSAYYGKGIYERTQETSYGLQPTNKEGPMLNQLTPQKNVLKTLTKTKTDLKTETKTETKVGFNLKNILKERTKEKAIERPKQEEKNSQIAKIKQPLSVKQEQIPLTKAVPRLTKRTAKPRKTKVNTPKIKIPMISPPSKTLQRLAKEVEGFEAFGFKSGSAKKVAEGTKEEVAIGLSKFLKKDLAASGFVTEKGTGRKLSFKEIQGLVGSDFRAGIKDPFKIVEKRSKRLRKGGTGKKIQAFRKGKIKGFSLGEL